MGKIITSPVARWPGTVTIPDELTLPQFAAWEDCLIEARASKGVSSTQLAYLPGILKIVEAWNLDGGWPTVPTLDNIPAKPYAPRIDLLSWLINEILTLWLDEGEVPND